MNEKSMLVIGSKKPGISTNWIVNEAEKIFKKVKYVPINDIFLRLNGKKPEISHGKEDLSRYDYCFPRIDAVRAQHGYHIIRFLDMIGMKKPYSAETVLIAHNKYMSLEVLRQADVPIPETYLVSSKSAAENVLKKMEYPVVIKIVSGFGGKGVMLLENLETALSVVDTLKMMDKQIIIEEFIQNPGEDKRAFVVGGKVVASYKRTCRHDDFRSNIMSGGKAHYTKLSEEMEDVALRAASAVSSDIVAIDMLETAEGPKVIEVNINPGIKGINAHVNVAKIMAEYAASQV